MWYGCGCGCGCGYGYGVGVERTDKGKKPSRNSDGNQFRSNWKKRTQPKSAQAGTRASQHCKHTLLNASITRNKTRLDTRSLCNHLTAILHHVPIHTSTLSLIRTITAITC